VDLVDGTNTVKLESSHILSTDHIFITKAPAGYDQEYTEDLVQRLSLPCMQEQQLLSNNCKCTAGLSESECASVESRCEKKFWFKRNESCPDLQTLRQNLETMFAAGHTTGTVDHPSIEVTGNFDHP
jgi:hypothetical protein